MTMLFAALPRDLGFAERLAFASDCELLPVSVHNFPDSETVLRLGADARGRRVSIVAGLREPDVHTVSVLLLAEALRDAGASQVGLVAPYLPYMRQDAAFHSGEAVTARSYARLISRSFDWLLTVDPHLHRIHRLSEIYDIPASAVHVAPELGRWIAANVDAPLIVGPDEESRQWVAAVAASAGAPFLVGRKVRRGDEDVVVETPPVGEFPDRTPVLVDDIVSTGRTLATAVRRIAPLARRAPICVAVHALFVERAEVLLRDAGAGDVGTTNTVEHTTNRIDVIPLLASELRIGISREAACMP